ncbi:MAG: GntR family transcriptional regulator [Bacteroidota bacterium]
MNTVYHKIQELEEVTRFSKHEQLVQGIINAIEDKIVTQGSMLPSVNNMVKELGFASKTIVKAYSELKDRGLVESKNRLGYFVVNEATEQTVKVALLIYAFHPFQQVFYNTFRMALGENIQVDVFFHHNNIDIFETILGKIKGQYGMYVIAPIPHQHTKMLLRSLPSKKLLMVDRFEQLEKDFSHITQEFESSTYRGLAKLADNIKAFKEFVLFFQPDSDYPQGLRSGFEQFLEDFDVKGRIVNSYVPQSVERGTVYFTINDNDLWGILKDCKAQGLDIGKDVGILSNSEDPAKELICDGITTLSTDFAQMGQQAAEFVLNRETTQQIIPTILTRRKSL